MVKTPGKNLSFNFKLASKIYLKKDFIADMFLSIFRKFPD